MSKPQCETPRNAALAVISNTPVEVKATPLKVFINKEFQGVRKDFADYYKIPRQNVKGLIDRGSVIVNGEIMVPYTRHQTKKEY